MFHHYLFSSSIRRVSMREKTAISWREAREEAKIRDSANTLNVDDDDEPMEKQDKPEKNTLQVSHLELK